MRPTLASCCFALVLAAGCAPVEYRGSVAVASAPPDLVYVGPGVQVIANYDEPIFYSSGFYWWFFGDTWYRSSVYTGGWVSVAAPPAVIVQIRQPVRYRYYRPVGYVPRHRPVPVRRVQRPIAPAPRGHRR